MLHVLDQRLWFPPLDDALADGLLAIGGDLSEQRLLLAYRKGIFPWYEDDVPLWWSPDPRFVLFPQQLKISKSMKQLLKRNAFEFTVNKDFESVIRNCRAVARAGQQGTWITDEVVKAYTNLHKKGIAISAEAWKDGKLAGGLYGIRMGKLFFGESMFTHVSNASKYAFIQLIHSLQKDGLELVDCQVFTEHLESLGAEMISRKKFVQFLDRYL